MSINVSIPKEITEYEEKIIFGLSLRKLVCLVSAILLCVGSYLLLTKVAKLSMDITSYIVILEAIPIMAIGFIKKDGMTADKYAALILRHKLGRNKLSYATELCVDLLIQQEQTTEERKLKKDGKPEKGRKAKPPRETQQFACTKKGRKVKCKAARSEIKGARKEYRTAKREAKKESKRRRRAEKRGAADPL